MAMLSYSSIQQGCNCQNVEKPENGVPMPQNRLIMHKTA